MGHIIVLKSAPATIVILLLPEPVACLDRRLQTVLTSQLRITGYHSVHNLARIEDHRPTARLCEMTGKGTVGELD